MKLRSKLFFFIIILLILNSCGSSKTVTEYKEVIKRDSIYITKEKKVIERVKDTILIESACDSLGNLKPFQRSLSFPQGNISLFSDNGNIGSTIDLKGYESIIEKRYQLMYDKKVSELKERVVTNIIPFKIWIIISLESFIILLLIKLKWF